jgi:hypothetical protein
VITLVELLALEWALPLSSEASSHHDSPNIAPSRPLHCLTPKVNQGLHGGPDFFHVWLGETTPVFEALGFLYNARSLTPSFLSPSSHCSTAMSKQHHTLEKGPDQQVEQVQREDLAHNLSAR